MRRRLLSHFAVLSQAGLVQRSDCSLIILELTCGVGICELGVLLLSHQALGEGPLLDDLQLLKLLAHLYLFLSAQRALMLDWISVPCFVALGRSSCLRHLVLLYVTLGELEEAADVVSHRKPFVRREIARALVKGLVVMLLGNEKARRHQVLSVKQFGIPTVCLTVALLESPLHPRRVLQLALVLGRVPSCGRALQELGEENAFVGEVRSLGSIVDFIG